MFKDVAEDLFYNKLKLRGDSWYVESGLHFLRLALMQAYNEGKAAQHSVQADACSHLIGEWIAPFMFHCTVCGETIQRR